ncbi:hypothetical protein chiPu_0027148, partial [Chiloscyllium punctatum]|nr:hypothetical protein [Chiloscyllium punctatum]
ELTEQIDPGLRPVLVREIYSREGQDYIRIGNKEVEYNSNFRLYMTTRISNPNFLPAVCNLVTLINCTVTFEGLQEQLLSRVVKRQHPQVEEQLGQLLQSIANDLGDGNDSWGPSQPNGQAADRLALFKVKDVSVRQAGNDPPTGKPW